MGRAEPARKTRHLHNRPRLTTTVQTHDPVRCRNCRNARGSEDSQQYPDVKAGTSEDWYAARSRLQPETTGRWMAQLAPLLHQRNRLSVQLPPIRVSS